MGCDIHMFAEYKTMSNGCVVFTNNTKTEYPPKPIWRKIDKFFLNQYYDPTDNSLTDWNSRNPLSDEPWQERWYLLFAKLADVRNYWGIEPLSQPRGIPDDADRDTITALEMADHSFSYFTLEELKRFDWSNSIEIKNDDEKEYVSLAKFEFTINQLDRICYGLKIKPSEIRIVFGFDN